VGPRDESPPEDRGSDEFVRFRDYIRENSGIYLEDSKADSLRISLIARATRYGLRTLGEYYDVMRADEQEFRELLSLVTINETSFFRFPEQFEVLGSHVLPELLDSAGSASKNLRFWSAGCSTGEEPYSIAMTLLDSGLLSDDGSGNAAARIVGTDVSSAALARARAALYAQRTLQSVSADRIARHFTRTQQGWRVNDEARSMCSFGYHNLAKDAAPAVAFASWDVIFCRNVTIYFQPESTRRIVRGFFEALRPGGYLFIGHSETLNALSDEFEMREVKGVFVYRRPAMGELSVTSRRVSPPERAASKAALHGKPADVVPAGGAERHSAAGQGSEDPRAAEECDEQGLTSAIALADAGDGDGARAAAARMLEADPLCAPAHHLLGVLSQREGETERAVQEFRRTLYADPDFALAHVSLANIQRERGERDDARRSYENAIRAVHAAPDGAWTLFLGGFAPELVERSCERGLAASKLREPLNAQRTKADT
jgi:chemotaxis protein methyltransferase CheR